MWCLETIIALNEKIAQGKTLGEAYVECGIRGPATERVKVVTKPSEEKEQPPCGMLKPLPLKVVA